MKKIRLFFDMDGVFYKWRNASFEETFRPGFFLDAEMDQTISASIEEIEKLDHELDLEISFLTAVYTTTSAAEEKSNAVRRDGFARIPIIFVPYGEEKAKYIDAKEDELCVLVDDFSKNLHEWKAAGGLGFKYYNGLNGTHGTWTGYSINNKMSPREIATEIIAIAEAVGKEEK